MSRKLLAVSLALIVSVSSFVLRQPSRAIYSYDISHFIKLGIFDRQVRVQGTLVHGSFCRVDPGCAYRFTLQGSGELLDVAYDACVLPDTVRDVPGVDVELVVEGSRCASCHTFQADNVIAQCPSKYEVPRADSPYRQATKIARCRATPRM